MTVEELIQILSTYKPQVEVCIMNPYGDINGNHGVIRHLRTAPARSVGMQEPKPVLVLPTGWERPDNGR